LERQDLSRTYLAHHELESEFIIIIIIIIIINIIILCLVLLQDTMNDDEQGGITSQNLQASTLMSPSIKLPQSFYSQLQQIGKPVFSWVVDSPLQLRSALSKNVDGIISNDPLFLKLVLKSWWKRCRGAQ